MSTIPKTYDPHSIEDRWSQRWLDAGIFHSDPGNEGEPYTIVIPPPNVTGILHMGHALNNTIQDVLIRSARMRGRNACWIPGTDHASIATEGKVVAMLAEKGITKSDISRDEFLEHAWDWKAKYGGIITGQLKRLGCACDWQRERFTMDETYTRSVLEAFVHLYGKGLIYRGNRLVNWCPASRSAISDEEVIYRDVDGKLWYFRYPVEGSDRSLIVATTRPETMLGDTAVAVHPKDKRYADLVGKTVRLPLVGREMPVIADEFVDPEFGTGCVKVTPAHDPNDFEMGVRHELEFINIMNEDASMNDRVPEAYRGLSREDARKQVVADLDAQGFLDKTEDYRNSVGYSQRGDVPIEHYMSDQWFMRMEELSKPALEAVRSGKLSFHPAHWAKTYEHWMENIRDWCISRQLWWGQRIPVWYKKGSDRNEPANRHVSIDGPPDPENWEQDEDVLDTWASSWIWPMAVQSWPDDSPELEAYYPTAVLVTGFDIIFFWVARMVMAGCEFMDELPFKDVFIHGIVRDDVGRKMSKSLGNSIDPLTIVDQYSADALRFSLVRLTAAGGDLVLFEDSFEVGRNFGTKIWNAARYMQMNSEDFQPDVRNPNLNPELLRPDDIHILSRLSDAIDAFNSNLDKYRLNDSALALYEFIWHQYCDWYVESTKEVLNGDDPGRRENVLTVMHVVFWGAIRLLHPIMPFLTEELAHMMGTIDEDRFLINEPLPKSWTDEDRARLGIREEIVAYVDAKHEVIRSARTLMADYGVLPSDKVRFILKSSNGDQQGMLESDKASLVGLLRVGDVEVRPDYTPESAMPSDLTPMGPIYMPAEGLIDMDAERARLGKQFEKVEKDLKGVEGKLNNPKFTDRAPEHVVQQQVDKRVELRETHEKIARLIEALGS